ncbi:MAG: NAD(P)H-dependent oxidoreductase subunit E, partial [Pseudomonadota bacterium]
ACVNAPMVQVNDDYYEDLTPQQFEDLLDKLQNGAETVPGPQIDRQTSGPAGGLTSLLEADLFDGTRNNIVLLPNLPTDGPETPAPAPSVEKTTLIKDAKPALKEADKPEIVDIAEGEEDNLKEIKGIGPANQKALNELGIFKFSQIAAWTPANVDWVEDFMSFPGRIEREDWIAQAKVLAAGDETEFSKRVEAGEVESSKTEGED